MLRRKFLTTSITAGTTLSLSGCSGDTTNANSPTETSTPTKTDSPTSTSTPEKPDYSAQLNAPNSAAVGESIQVSVEVSNSGGRNGTFSSEISFAVTAGPEPQPEDWDTDKIDLFVAAGDTRSWSSRRFSFERPVVVFVRLEDRPVRAIDIPSSRAPIMETVNLVSEWQSYGDTIDNQIQESEVGSVINISSRYWSWIENQTQEVFRQVEIYDSADDRAGINTARTEQVTEHNGWLSWESYLSFDTRGWESGTYTGEVLIRDEQNRQVSNKGTTEFRLVD